MTESEREQLQDIYLTSKDIHKEIEALARKQRYPTVEFLLALKIILLTAEQNLAYESKVASELFDLGNQVIQEMESEQ